MKLIRSTILFFACILGFVMQAEIFQTQLWCFDSAYYKIMRYEVEDENLEKFLKDIHNEAKKNNVSIFTTDIYMQTKHSTIINIYGNDKKIKNDLYRVMNIEEQEYFSFLSGSAQINYKDYYELLNLRNNSKKSLSFIGNEKNINKVYETISKSYNVSYPEYFEATEEDMVIIVWSMIIFLIIVMNCIDVLRRKKEVVIRISLGEGAGNIIARSIIEDIILYVISYVLARKLAFSFVSGEYAKKLAIIMFIIGAIISFLPYIAFAFYNIRKAFSNVNDSKEVLYVMYGLKIVVTALTIFTITTNLSSIYWNSGSDDELIEQYKEFNHITLGNTTFDDTGEELFWNEIYENKYNVLKPVICINVLQEQSDYILVNDNAKGMLQGFNKMIKEAKNDADFIVFISKHQSMEKCEKTAIECLDSFLHNDIDEMNIQVIQYAGREKFLYMSSDENQTIDTALNPVIIYQNSGNAIYDGANVERYAGNQIFFGADEDDLKNICTQYEKYISQYNFIVTNVYESYSIKKNFIMNLIRFLSSFCIVVLILDIAVVITVSSMEYRTHSMEISIKKVIGYGLYERNKRIIKYSILSDMVLLFVMCIMGMITNILDIHICFTVGMLIIICEMIIMACNIIKVENENVYKVLKGGCL